jgi:vancomycin permeability regulator SanA
VTAGERPVTTSSTARRHTVRAASSRTRRPWWRRPGFYFRVLVVLLLGAVVYVGVTFAQVWEASRQDAAGPAQAIVVLGAAQYNGTPSPVLKERLDHALALYRNGDAPRIVVTGGRQSGDRYTEATASYDYLRHAGVPDADILKEVQGRSTYESLSAAARVLHARDVRQVVFVTSPAHAERVRVIAGEVGLHGGVSPTSHRAPLSSLGRETVAVAVGRVVGFGRLDSLDHR